MRRISGSIQPSTPFRLVGTPYLLNVDYDPNQNDKMAHVVPRELDLNSYGHDSIVDKINAFPGLRTSAAFFTFLRANLNVNPSAMSSNANTPMLEPISPPLIATVDPDPVPALSSPSSSPSSPAPPPLTTEVLREESDKAEALRLVADSIAQQRQTASRHLIFHPYLFAGLLCVLALTFQVSWRVRRDDLGTALLLHAGVVMIYLLGIRYFTGRYIEVAEGLKWDWLRPGTTKEGVEEDTVIGVRFGDEVIGALVLRLEANPSFAGNKRRSRGSFLRGGKGVIRAWTVRLKYRHKGVGSDLLHEAVKVTREKCGKDAEVGFAKEHANSAMVLPEVFNGHFRKGEQKAAKALDGVLVEWEGSRRKR